MLHARHEAHARTANAKTHGIAHVYKNLRNFQGGFGTLHVVSCIGNHMEGTKPPLTPGNFVGFLHHPRPAYNSNGPPHIRLREE